MLFKQLIEAFDIIDSKNVNGNSVASYLKSIKQDADIQVYPLVGPKGSTDMLKIRIPGLHGKTSGGDAPTIGLLGRLGGLGARPERIGYVSDGDGALVAIALAAKLLDMQNKGDFLEGDVFISTHICPDAPTAPHVPVPFMGSPVEMAQVNAECQHGYLCGNRRHVVFGEPFFQNGEYRYGLQHDVDAARPPHNFKVGILAGEAGCHKHISAERYGKADKEHGDENEQCAPHAPAQWVCVQVMSQYKIPRKAADIIQRAVAGPVALSPKSHVAVVALVSQQGGGKADVWQKGGD